TGSACGREPAAPPSEPATATPTFTRDVAPLLYSRCAPCHNPDGSAPFSVLDYGSVSPRAAAIADVTSRGVMPPWLPEAGYGRFAGERRLAPKEVDLIRRWARGGAPEGDASALPPPPAGLGAWQLGQPDLVLKLANPYTLPPGSTDVWRNFVIPVPIDASRFVRTVEIRPGNPRFVHHAQMAVDDSQSSRRLDARDPEQGFEGMDMGDAYMPDGSLIGWTPGMLPFPGVKGASWRLPTGSDFVLQLHMLPTDKPETIDPSIGVHFSDTNSVGTPMYVFMLDADNQLDIPPGHEAFVIDDRMTLPVDVEVHAVYPHAHYLGKTLEASATLPDGSVKWLLRIGHWDFMWQDVYRLEAPLPLPAGTVVHMRWIYDNSEQSPHQQSRPPIRVKAGNRSSDEMAHLQIQVALRTPADRLRLQEAYFRYLLAKDPRNARFLYGLAGTMKDQGRLPDAERLYRAALAAAPNHAPAHLNLGAVLLQLGRIPDGVDQLLAAVRLEPASPGAHYNLGLVFAAQGRLVDAVRHYREAIQYRPDFGEAHNNLGQILRAVKQTADAVAHLRQAARILPESADIQNNLGETLVELGQRAEARTHFERALTLDPQHADARRNLDRLSAADERRR
ncbi:MAG: tetratricopeptide repeat protein, partial [Vicinamibacterales bacterium]